MGAKVKTIKQVMRAKIDDWCSSIEDEELVRAIKRDTIVTGGSITSMLLGEKINDFDIYFRTKNTAKAVADHYVAKFNEVRKPYQATPKVVEATITNIHGDAEEVVQIYVESAGVVQTEANNDGYDYSGQGELEESVQAILEKDMKLDFEEVDVEKPPYRVVYMSQNAITLADQIQIVLRFYGNPEEIHRSFDFSHAKCWYSYTDNHLETPVDALQHTLARNLHYSGSLYPLASLFRIKKFIQRGWKCSAGEMVKIAWQLSEIELNDMKVLKEQLTGVDAMFLHMLYDAIQDWKNNNGDENIHQNYVMEIVDRIFS